ncbi:hypothetical protein QC762_112507 [Podospora pseudocomata]|uniref:Uncharacterized protein n=1 Tax=Podospora pseudocomata TaxID=2093779 RepID=A0ABR0GVI5_9PEZI|nr:hypothetical protein QC762_112507 [Podospora pseudocomata]
MGQVYEPLSTGRTPLPSMHPPRCTAGPSLLRNSDSYTRGAGPQAAETTRPVNKAVTGLERRETEGFSFQPPPGAYHQPQRSQEMGTRQAETYMTGPQRDFQPGRTSSHPVPVPSNNWPTSFSPEEIRQVQTIYSITFGATYTGNIGSFYHRPVPQQLITASIRSSASPGMPPSNTFGPQHHQNVGTASRLLPPIFSTGYGHRSSDKNEKMTLEDERLWNLPHSTWLHNHDVSVIRQFKGDLLPLSQFWDAFNLYCSQNNIQHAHRATNRFVDQKWHLDIKERDARQAERKKEHE